MAEPPDGILGGDGCQTGGDGVLERGAVARSRLAQRRLELAEGVLDGGEVWGVGREKAEVTAGGFDAPAQRLVPMHAEVVPDDDLPRP